MNFLVYVILVIFFNPLNAFADDLRARLAAEQAQQQQQQQQPPAQAAPAEPAQVPQGLTDQEVHDQYTAMKDFFTLGGTDDKKLDALFVAKALNSLLLYVIVNNIATDENRRKFVERAVQSLGRLLKEEANLIEQTDALKNLRSRLFLELQKAVERSSNLMETKRTLIKVLSGDV